MAFFPSTNTLTFVASYVNIHSLIVYLGIFEMKISVFDELVIYFALSSFVGLVLTGIRLRCLEASSQWYSTLRVAASASLWYSISISFTIFNKYFMQLWRGGRGFAYPILVTTLHMCIKVVISRVWMSCTRNKRYPNGLMPPISWPLLLTVVMPIGVLTALDVMLSNFSILFIPLSVYTAVKASAPIFTFMFGIALGTETFSAWLFLALGGIAFGLAIAVVSALDVTVLGLTLCFGAAASGGLRWALTQLLLQSDADCNSHIMVPIYWFSPMSAMAILPMGAALELPRFLEVELGNPWQILVEALVITCCGGLISFLLIAVEMNLLTLTSSVNLGVLGTIKEMLQITLSILIFRERMNVQTVLGLFFAIGSGLAYRYIKASTSSPSSSESGQLGTHSKPHGGGSLEWTRVALESPREDGEEDDEARQLIEMQHVQSIHGSK